MGRATVSLFLSCCLFACSAAAFAAGGAQPGPQLLLRGGAVDPASLPPVVAAAKAAGPRLQVVQFAGPIQPAWRAAIDAAGLKVLDYLPDYAYVVWGDDAALGKLISAAPARWSGDYRAAWALHPAVAALAKSAWIDVNVQIVDAPEGEASLAAIVGAAAEVLRAPRAVLSRRNVTVRIPSDRAAWAAALPGVLNVEPYVAPRRMDEMQGVILAESLTNNGASPAGPGYLTWLRDTLHFSTSAADYPIVDVTDDGIDNGTTAPLHPDFYTAGNTAQAARLVYNYNWTTDASADGQEGHGNLNASIVGGYNDKTGSAYKDAAGYSYGLGVNPFGRIAGSKVFTNSGSWGTTAANSALTSNSYALGARITNNSWGADTYGVYNTDCQEYDALVRDAQPGVGGAQEMITVFSAGNSGPAGTTVASPGSAKNVISVGASESVRPDWTDGCAVGTTGADNALDIADFSSRGPTADQRIKPDIVAPGTHIIGAASQDLGYSGTGVCDKYHPDGQTLYAASSGTSHSAPAVAGAASLFYHFYQNLAGGAAPSPAMTKAWFVNSARYLTGVSANDALPSVTQGFGILDLKAAFDGTARFRHDQDALLTASGQSFRYAGVVADPTKPFRVTLAWTDAPGATTGNAYVNNLDLAVTVGGKTYLGNVFSGGTSVEGGTADARNNVESVFIPAGVSGPFAATVVGTNIAGDGVPVNGYATDQDFALVIYNARTCIGAPTDVSARGDGDNAILVQWTGVAGAAEYHVYRGFSLSGPFTLAGTAAAGATSFVDAVSGGITYYYQVRAFADCESDVTGTVAAGTSGACTEAPTFAGVASVADTKTAACGLQLGWSAATAHCGGQVHYRVHRSTSASFAPGPGNLIADGLGGTSFVDRNNLANGTTQYYIVRAVDGANGIADTNVAARGGAPSGVVAASNLLSESFAAGDPPTGWTVVNGGSSGATGWTWTTTNPKSRAIPAGMTAPIEIIDSDGEGNGVTQDDSLITPAFAVAAGGSYQLSFDTFYRAYSASAAYVDVTINGGATWTTVATYGASDVGSATAAGHQTIDVTSAVAGGTSAQVRFRYTGAWDWYWMIDNVAVDQTLAGACSAAAVVGPAEASAAGTMTCRRGTGTAIQVSYAPACGATDHAAFWTLVPAGGVADRRFHNAACSLGAGGSAAFDPGPVGAGGLVYFVLVGQDGSSQGSFGRTSAGVERESAYDASWACNRAQILGATCP
ncbi:S8 family serine peptidase [bacterium]|nr:S8 family serine peptidase [bacterium]